MSNEKNKITWQCYPSNVESFESVNFPEVNDAIKSRQNYYEEVNKIDNLPNYEVPDNTGPVYDFQGPKNSEPVRQNGYLSTAPIIVMTDVEPGMIMPGNISVSLPQYMDENQDFVYPNADQEFNHDTSNSLHGDDILNVNEINNDTPLPSQNVPTLNQPFNVAKPNSIQVALEQKPIRTQAPVLNSVQTAIPLNRIDTIPNKMVTGSKSNKMLHKILMYVAIGLLIYLIYVILFEKN